MKTILCASVLAFGFVIAAPASAQVANGSVRLTSAVEGVTYFNRSGATLEQQRADLETCDTTVLAMEQPFQSSGAGAAYGLVGVLVETSMAVQAQRVAQRRARLPHYENCMVLRGWRVVRVNDTLGAELDALEQPALAERLAPMVGAETPEGEIVRVFQNEIADGATFLWSVPSNNQQMSLSLQALPPESSAFIAPGSDRPRRTVQEQREIDRRNGMTPELREQRRNERRQAREEQQAQNEIRERTTLALVGPGDVATPVRERNIARLADNSTVLVVRVHGAAYGSGMMFTRLGSEEGTVDFVNPIVPTAFISGPKEQTIVAVVPAGRWRISAFNASTYVTSLCMGAPTFDVAEGEVVFAGSFGFGAEGDRLDLSLDPARAALATAPGLAARVRAAEYRNGATFECGGVANFYSYEIAGAPFDDDYRFGSQANVVVAAADQVTAVTQDASAAAAETPAAAPASN